MSYVQLMCKCFFVYPIGMVKTFQLSNRGKYGSSIKVAPITTDTITNVDTCLEVNGTSDMKIQPQSIVPDTSGMEVKRNACMNSVIINMNLATSKIIIYICSASEKR